MKDRKAVVLALVAIPLVNVACIADDRVASVAPTSGRASAGIQYTRLGRIDDPSGLAAALGNGSVEATFDAE